MKLLTVAYNFPPIRGPESIQANRLVKYCEQCDIRFDIVTRCVGCGTKFNNRITQYGNVIRAYSLDNCLLKGTMRLIGRDLERRPDAEVLWYPFALASARKCLKSNRYDILYTRSVPFTSHMIGLNLKLSSDIPWVAHFSDPWTDNPYISYESEKIKQKNLFWEKSVIEQANCLIFTSQETVDIVMRKYDSSLLSKVHVLPHSYENDLTKIDGHQKRAEQKTRMTYVGNFYGKRSPDDFLRAIDIAKDMFTNIHDYLEVHFFGNIPRKMGKRIKDLERSGLVIFHGEVSYEEGQREMSKADVLINIDAPGDSSMFLPSKVIEYLAFGKPILSLTPDKGTTARILKQAGHICIENEKHVTISKVILRIAKHGTGWVDFNREAKDEYKAEAVANKFMEIIKDQRH